MEIGSSQTHGMDQPLPLPYLVEKNSRHEKHTESVKREESEEVGRVSGSGNKSGRRIEIGEPLPLGYNKTGEGGKVIKMKRERVRIDLGDPLPLELKKEVKQEIVAETDSVSVGEENTSGNDISVSEGEVRPRGNVVEKKNTNEKYKQKKTHKVIYDFGTPLPLDYTRRSNMTSQCQQYDKSQEESDAQRLPQSSNFSSATTSSPLEGTTLAETLQLDIIDKNKPFEETAMELPTTEELLLLAAQTHPNPLRELIHGLSHEKLGPQYRLIALRAHRIACRQAHVLGEALGIGVSEGTETISTQWSQRLLIGCISLLILLCLALLSFSLAD